MQQRHHVSNDGAELSKPEDCALIPLSQFKRASSIACPEIYTWVVMLLHKKMKGTVKLEVGV